MTRCRLHPISSVKADKGGQTPEPVFAAYSHPLSHLPARKDSFALDSDLSVCFGPGQASPCE